MGGTTEGVCPLCGPVTVRTLPFRYRFHERHLYGVRCETCSLVFLHPMPSDAEIRGMYTEEYFTECTESCGAHGPRAYMEMVEDSAPERRRSAARLDRTLTEKLGRRGDFLEIGCGPGFLLADMRSIGWSVRGLEISEFAAREARERLGLDVVTGALGENLLPAGSADAVFLGDVLEHLPRPLEALAEVSAVLRHGGVVAIAVPSTLNLVSGRLGLSAYRALGRVKTLRIPPYHLVEYTPRTLRRTLQTAGFAVLSIRQSTVPIRRMGLRGSAVENAGKVSLQVLARLTSAIANRGGDRLLALARKGK